MGAGEAASVSPLPQGMTKSGRVVLVGSACVSAAAAQCWRDAYTPNDGYEEEDATVEQLVAGGGKAGVGSAAATRASLPPGLRRAARV